jgi:hypothetical protein
MSGQSGRNSSLMPSRRAISRLMRCTRHVRSGSGAAVAGRLIAQPVYPQLRKSPCDPALTLRANKRHQLFYPSTRSMPLNCPNFAATDNCIPFRNPALRHAPPLFVALLPSAHYLRRRPVKSSNTIPVRSAALQASFISSSQTMYEPAYITQKI